MGQGGAMGGDVLGWEGLGCVCVCVVLCLCQRFLVVSFWWWVCFCGCGCVVGWRVCNMDNYSLFTLQISHS